MFLFFFFFNDTATTEIYTLSLHDALPISDPFSRARVFPIRGLARPCARRRSARGISSIARSPPRNTGYGMRSEEHTSELQSRLHLVCRLLLEKKKKQANTTIPTAELHPAS